MKDNGDETRNFEPRLSGEDEKRHLQTKPRSKPEDFELDRFNVQSGLLSSVTADLEILPHRSGDHDLWLPRVLLELRNTTGISNKLRYRKNMTYYFSNESKTLEAVTSATTVFDANVAANQKLCSNPRKKFSLPELNYSRGITTTITRLRTKHFKDMKILSDGSRSYVECRHCTDMQLDSQNLFSCPSIVVASFKINNDCSMDILYSDRAMDVAMARIHAFGNI
ncbi:RNase H domain-containing protein [Trichonephila clavipes]|nr:RNase H domain-containing protein [Trichonephila clavipes]